MLAQPMKDESAEIIVNRPEVGLYHLLMLRAPGIAPLVAPGQFVHLRIWPCADALLRRPFSVYRVEGDCLSILYKVVGKGTAALARMPPGEHVAALGPLGHGFSLPCAGGGMPILVAGGYGVAALYLLAERSPVRGILFQGGRRKEDILCEPDFRALGWEVRVATEDGSWGTRGLVTDLLREELRSGGRGAKLYACGPTGMLRAVAQLAEEYGLPAELSLDERMCCGMGVCLTCVVPVRTDTGWEYQRACTEGPVFDARQLLWEVPS
ncbi:MAG: dihydroorotate dehydrogenase electron transfer subunit [Verrucomicrobiota bacterium]|nr:dihydroorotate dehydrogenase electron transfer subunit [Limisphaera sp.]MDW8382886.1 dihydroorotate dehydrogenase electron transfer subunit [Verrucomicrobiota bacterium]